MVELYIYERTNLSDLQIENQVQKELKLKICDLSWR